MSDGVRLVTMGRRRVRVAVRVGTDPTRPPLLVCNGIGASLELLEPFVAALDPAVTVVRFDPPGVGGSPSAPLPAPFPVLARLAGRLLDALGYGRFDVLGISWGGALAQQLAMQNPRRCRRLVLVATAPGWTMLPGRPRVLLRMAGPRRHRDTAHARTIAGELYGGRLRERPDLVDRLLTGPGLPPTRLGYLHQLAAGLGWSSLPFLPLLRQPTLVVAGSDDPIIPLANAHLLRRLIPRAHLIVHPDGHLALLTLADDLAPRIAAFLAADA